MSTAEIALSPGARIVRSVFHLSLGQVATTAMTILYTAVVARTLGASDFGLLYILTSFATFAYVFVDWGHGPYIIREIARRPERAGDLVGSVLVVRAVTAILVCGVAVGVTWLLGYEPRTQMLTGAIIIAWI